jgi:hypothetical protein
MRLTTWCGSVIDTSERKWTIWLRWLEGWLRAGWRPLGIASRAKERQQRTGWPYPVLIATEIGRVVAAIALVLVVAILLVGCGDNQYPQPDFPRTARCVEYESYMVSADEDVVPSLVPAPGGVRIIVDDDIRPFWGASYPVPGGRMVWNVWVFRWYDGDHLGTIGRVGDTEMCRWYDPHISG